MADKIVTANGKPPGRASAIHRAQSGGKMPRATDDNVVREEQSKGTVRPDGPGDSTAPVTPEPSTSGPAIRGIKPTAARAGRTKRAPARTVATRTRRR